MSLPLIKVDLISNSEKVHRKVNDDNNVFEDEIVIISSINPRRHTSQGPQLNYLRYVVILYSEVTRPGWCIRFTVSSKIYRSANLGV